ncbi:hypothetical protein PoB_005420300 [Plakobranchus ocellatus]|uniref:Uncharacterized protein n=1 Tax=Plakobranchus ocellatus TaxID=259542 RepID=A0AAV4C761_9GAST|nr:hypothetical protein PoB_005420300 [Plakobranchus ocellatus]
MYADLLATEQRHVMVKRRCSALNLCQTVGPVEQMGHKMEERSLCEVHNVGRSCLWDFCFDSVVHEVLAESVLTILWELNQ